MNSETKASSISNSLDIALQDVEQAILAAEDLLVVEGEDEESRMRATAILGLVIARFSELRKSFERYVRQVEFGGRLPFDPECEALIRANPARLLPQQMDWFRKFHHEHPEAARQFIEGASIVGQSAVPASESEGGGSDQRERRRQCLAIMRKLRELPLTHLEAVNAYLTLPVPEAPKPVQPGRATGHGGAKGIAHIPDHLLDRATGHGGAKAKGRVTPNAGRKLRERLSARA